MVEFSCSWAFIDWMKIVLGRLVSVMLSLVGYSLSYADFVDRAPLSLSVSDDCRYA